MPYVQVKLVHYLFAMVRWSCHLATELKLPPVPATGGWFRNVVEGFGRPVA